MASTLMPTMDCCFAALRVGPRAPARSLHPLGTNNSGKVGGALPTTTIGGEEFPTPVALTYSSKLAPAEGLARSPAKSGKPRSKSMRKFSTTESPAGAATVPLDIGIEEWLSSSEDALLLETIYNSYSSWEQRTKRGAPESERFPESGGETPTRLGQDERGGNPPTAHPVEATTSSSSGWLEGKQEQVPGFSSRVSTSGVKLSKRKPRLDLASRVVLKQRASSREATTTGTRSRKTQSPQTQDIGIDIDQFTMNNLLDNYSDITLSVANGAALPRLSSETEAQLGKLMKILKSIEDSRQSLASRLQRPPSPEELAQVRGLTPKSLETQLRVLGAARNKLIVHNLGMLFRVVRHQSKKSHRLKNNELIFHALQGALKAALHYDPSKVPRFAYFAARCMERRVKLAISEFGYVERLPCWVTESARSVNRVRDELKSALGRPPTADELSKHTGIPMDRLKTIMRPFMPTQYLNDKDRITGEEFINTYSAPSSDSSADFERTLIRQDIFKSLEALTPNERHVVLERFGFKNSVVAGYTDLGLRMNISKQGVQFLERNAIKKLKKTSLQNHVHCVEDIVLV